MHMASDNELAITNPLKPRAFSLLIFYASSALLRRQVQGLLEAGESYSSSP